MIKPSILKYLLVLFYILNVIYYFTPRDKIVKEEDSNEPYENYLSTISDSTKYRPLDTLTGRDTRKAIYIKDSILSLLNPIKGSFLLSRNNTKSSLLRYLAPEIDTIKTSSIPQPVALDIKTAKIIATDLPYDTIMQHRRELNKVSINYIDDLNIGPDISKTSISTVDRIKGSEINYQNLDLFHSNVTIYARSIGFADCSFTSTTSLNLFAEDNVKIDQCEIGPATSITLEGNWKTKVSIIDSKLKGVDLKLFHAEVHLRNIRLDSTNTLTIGDDFTLEGLYGKGVLELKTKYFPKRTYKMNGEFWEDDYITKVTLKNIDTANIRLPDRGMNFIVDSEQSNQKKIMLYIFLINRYKNFESEKKKYDIAFQQYKDRINQQEGLSWIKENWNNFGYDNTLVFMNSVLVMLFFFLVNLFFYPAMLNKGYSLKQFIEADKLARKKNKNIWLTEIRNIVNCFLYTFFIFFGLKLDIEKLKVSNIGYSILIFIQYVIGIICLGYIANIILQSSTTQ